MVAKSLVEIQVPADPGANLQLSTKQYVDTGLSGKAASSHSHAESDVTSLTTDLAGKAPTASPSFTGTATFGGAMVQTPVSLTDASTVTVNAALGNIFNLLTTSGVGSTRAIGAPSNATDAQMILFRIRQDGTGSRLVTWNAIYTFGTDITAAPTLTTTANKVDYLGFIYDSTNSHWHLLSYARGYG